MMGFRQNNVFDCSRSNVEPYQCQRCVTFRMYFLGQMRNHIEEGHTTKTSNELKIHKCETCGFETSSMYLVSQHALFGPCSTIGKGDHRNKYVLLKHLSEDQIRWYQCDECSSKFKTKKKLRSHVLQRHAPSENSLWLYYCDQCSYKSKSKELLKRHINMDLHLKHLKEKESSSTGPVPEDHNKWFQCEDCLSKFKTKDELRSHVLFRQSFPESINWFHCNKCAYKSKTEHILNHSSVPEDQKQWFQCEECPSKFKSKNKLGSHILLFHTSPESRLRCDKCAFTSKTKNELKMHILEHLSGPEDETQWFQCKDCPSKFNTKTELRRHVLHRHTPPEHISWFHCDKCAYKAKTKHTLKRHILKHLS